MALPPASPEDIRAFQRGALNHLGKPLKTDGVLGPETEWALDFITIPHARRSIIRVAQMFYGLVEDPVGSNTDPGGLIERWLKRCGARPRDPWCAAFMSHCIGSVRIAGAQALGRHYPPTSQPFAGDIGWFATDAIHGHCFLITGVGATEVMTLEGNLRNGVRSARRPRAGLRFSRTVPDTEGTCPGLVPSVPLVMLSKAGTR